MSTSLTFDNLMQAAHECSLGVKWKDSVSNWVHPRNIASNCIKLWRSLDNGSYKINGYVVFEVTEPKRRTIRSPRFCDRVVQRAMCDNGLYDDLTRGNIHDNSACQTGKGTTFAMDRLSCHLQRFWRKHGTDGWVLRLDIHKFFDSIPHEQLKEMVIRKVSNAEYVNRVFEIIDSFDDPGIGLGSQISQLLAISYLSDLDHYITEILGIHYYVRYSDDIVIIHHDKEYLRKSWNIIEEKLNELGLSLNPKSTLIPIKNGINFLKFRFYIKETGKVIRILNRKNTIKIRKRLKKLIDRCHNSDRQLNDVMTCFESWKAHASQGNSNSKIRKMNKWIIQQSLLQNK